jgi:hypothetical protein
MLLDILETYGIIMGMEVNIHNSIIYFHNLEEEIKVGMSRMFPFKSLVFQKTFKYLGFLLKPNGHGKKRWDAFLKRCRQG